MSKIKLTIYSTESDYSLEKGKAIIKKLIGESHVFNGVIPKFSFASNFSDLEDKPVKGDWCGNIRKVKSPDGFETPECLLFSSMIFLNEKEEIVSFVFDNKRMYHNIQKYSYNTLEIAIKFQNFLYKVYGNLIRVEISLLDSFKPLYKEKLLSHFYLCYAENKVVENEISLSRILKKKEIKYISDFFKALGEDIKIRQFFCETCYEGNPNKPYHTDLVYLEKNDEFETVKI